MTSSSSEGSGDGLVKGISMRDSKGSLALGGARALLRVWPRETNLLRG